MKILFEIVWFFWFFSEIFLNRWFRSKTNHSKGQDRNSLALIWVTIAVSIPVGVMSSIYLDYPIAVSGWVAYPGLVAIVTGILIRFIAILTLGKFFTVNLTIHADHRLIKSGLYHYVRHPSYSGSLLSFLGFGFTLNNWISLCVIFLPVLLAFRYRILTEEKMLLGQIGPEYEEYTKITRRLIPGVY